MKQIMIDRSKEIQEIRKIIDRAIISKDEHEDYVLTVLNNNDNRQYMVPKQYAKEFAEAILVDLGFIVLSPKNAVYWENIISAANDGSVDAAIWLLNWMKIKPFSPKVDENDEVK